MFEKEATEYATQDVFFDGVPKPVINHQRKEDWKKGAEFGYNKGKNEAKEIIKLLLWDLRNHSYNPEKDMARAEEFLGRNK